MDVLIGFLANIDRLDLAEDVIELAERSEPVVSASKYALGAVVTGYLGYRAVKWAKGKYQNEKMKVVQEEVKTFTQIFNYLKEDFSIAHAVADLCVGVHAFTIITNGTFINAGALHVPSILKGQVWRLASRMFIHADFIHLFMNMYSLMALRGLVEDLGVSGFAKVATLATGVEFFAKVLLKDQTFSVGLSGVIYSVLGVATISLGRNNTTCFNKELFGSLFVQSAVPGLISMSSNANIDHQAHAIGYLVGLAFGWYQVRQEQRRNKELMAIPPY